MRYEMAQVGQVVFSQGHNIKTLQRRKLAFIPNSVQNTRRLCCIWAVKNVYITKRQS